MKIEAMKRLLDASQALDAIERFTTDINLDSYLENELLQAAVERKFEILGEALKKACETEPSLADTIPDLRAIISMRNRIIHAYDAVDQLILWDAIHEDTTQLKQSLDGLISEE